MTSNTEGVGLRDAVEEIDKLVHEPARLVIMAHLFLVEASDFVFLVSQSGLTPGNISSHMKKLVSAGYVDVEKSFVRNRPQTTYSLTDSGRKAFTAYRNTITEIASRLPPG